MKKMKINALLITKDFSYKIINISIEQFLFDSEFENRSLYFEGVFKKQIEKSKFYENTYDSFIYFDADAEEYTEEIVTKIMTEFLIFQQNTYQQQIDECAENIKLEQAKARKLQIGYQNIIDKFEKKYKRKENN